MKFTDPDDSRAFFEKDHLGSASGGLARKAAHQIEDPSLSRLGGMESLLSDKTRKRIRALERLRKHLGRVKFAAWLTASQKKNFEERQWIWHNGERARKVEVES